MAEEESNHKKTKMDWRTKCIEEFELLPVPWQDEVARGSNEAWKKYYEYRSKFTRIDSEKGDDEGEGELLQDWEGSLEEVVFEILDPEESQKEKKWQTSLTVGNNLVFEDYDEIRTAQFYAHVWSPYAIPHAIHLEHRYHCRPRYSTVELYATWGYKCIDFHAGPPEPTRGGEEEEFKTICSNHFEDEVLRADVINTSGFNKRTTDRLRHFLFGTLDESKHDHCDDFSFWRLLFGSMGTFDYETLKGGDLGYKWGLGYERNQGLRERMIREGAIKEDDYPKISWLEHKMRQVGGALRKVDGFYRPPTIKDAPGYRTPECESDSDRSADRF
jgi:hypothetical protein